MSAPSGPGNGGDPGDTPHLIVNPPSMAPAVGFAHAVVSAPGRIIYLGGQTGAGPDGSVTGTTVAGQFDRAAVNVVTALAAVGARPEHLVSLTVYTTDLPAYRGELRKIGRSYRTHFGRHYPAMALFGVTELFDPDAQVELVGVAVAPGE